MIKPDWSKPNLANDEKNPKFIQSINGPDIIEGCNFSEDFISQKNQEGYNIYFFPNHPSKDVYADGIKFLSGKVIDVFDFVFVDMDLKDEVYSTKEEFLDKLSTFPLRPTMVVNSGNGVHAYWRVSDLTRDSYVFTQLALINFFKTDESVFTVLQLMRLPGYMNTKRHGDYTPAKIIPEFSSDLTYTLNDFPNQIFDLPKEICTRAENHLNKLDGKLKINLPEFVNLEELPDKFIDFILDPKNVASYNLFHSPKATHGDRSGADMKLANILCRSGFNKKEALAVLSNSEKALSKGPHRFSYAQNTIDKVYIEKLNAKFRTVGQMLRTQDNDKNLGDPIRSTWYFDTYVLGNPWRKKEVNGLIAGPGIGKTTVALKWVKDSIENNPHNDDVYIFISLEMPEPEIIKRWIKLVGKDSPLADRLYVIGNEDEKGDPRNIGLQEVHEYCSEIKKLSGKQIGILIIDHIGILSKHIDTRKKYTFGIDSEMDSGYGPIRRLSLNTLATHMKTLAKMLNVLVVPLTQTTKEKGQGDLPIDKDGAYGISQYENIMDRIITIWQPLMRVKTKTRFLAYQYAKIRDKHENDKIQDHEQKLLTFDITTGDLRPTTTEEYQEFLSMLPQAAQIREDLYKKKGNGGYSIHLTNDIINKVVLSLKPNNGEQNHESVAKVQPDQHSGTH